MSKRVYLSPSNQGGNAYIIEDTTEKAVCEEIAGYVRDALERPQHCGVRRDASQQET